MLTKYVIAGLIMLAVTGCASVTPEQYAQAPRECKVYRLADPTGAKKETDPLENRRAQMQLANFVYHRAYVGGGPNLLEDVLRDCY